MAASRLHRDKFRRRYGVLTSRSALPPQGAWLAGKLSKRLDFRALFPEATPHSECKIRRKFQLRRSAHFRISPEVQEGMGWADWEDASPHVTTPALGAPPLLNQEGSNHANSG
jgi:hypothetical protein